MSNKENQSELGVEEEMADATRRIRAGKPKDAPVERTLCEDEWNGKVCSRDLNHPFPHRGGGMSWWPAAGTEYEVVERTQDEPYLNPIGPRDYEWGASEVSPEPTAAGSEEPIRKVPKMDIDFKRNEDYQEMTTQFEKTIDDTLKERASRYGDFVDHAGITQELKCIMHATPRWHNLSRDKKEALEMIQHKIGRILNGDPNYKDSWTDIIGYAKLIEQNLKD